MNKKYRLIAVALTAMLVMTSGMFSAFAATTSKSYTLYTNMGAGQESTVYKVGTSAYAYGSNVSTATTNATIMLRRSIGGNVTTVATAIAAPGASTTTTKCSSSSSSDATWVAAVTPSAKLGAGTYYCSGKITLTTYN